MPVTKAVKKRLIEAIEAEIERLQQSSQRMLARVAVMTDADVLSMVSEIRENAATIGLLARIASDLE